MGWLYDVLFGWWLPRKKPVYVPPKPKAATNLRGKVWRYTIMTHKADVKFTWKKSVSTNVVGQTFSLNVNGAVHSVIELAPEVEEVRLSGFNSADVLDFAIKTTNSFGVHATVAAQFVVPDFSVAPATELVAEVTAIVEEVVEPATDPQAEVTDVTE